MIKEVRDHTLANVCYQVFCDKCNVMYVHYNGATITDYLTEPGGFIQTMEGRGWKVDEKHPTYKNCPALCEKCN